MLGELLVTAGVLVGLFSAWQIWAEPARIGAEQNRAARDEAARLGALMDQGAPISPDRRLTDGDIPTTAEPQAEAASLAVMYVPRFGSNWKRVIRQGVDTKKVLNSETAGVGHYPGTQMPGQPGNFAVAAHDTGWGNTFIALPELRLGDEIHVQTADGWYTYVFRNLEYIQPVQYDVVNPVPQTDLAPGDRLMTMTTCNPRYHGRERIAAFSTFRDFSTQAPPGVDETG